MKKNNQVLKFVIYAILLIYVFISAIPFFWTILTSIKVPIDAFSRVPKIIGFTPTNKNYVELWLKVPLEEFAPYGIAIIIIIAIGFTVSTLRLPEEKVAIEVARAFSVPRIDRGAIQQDVNFRLPGDIT